MAQQASATYFYARHWSVVASRIWTRIWAPRTFKWNMSTQHRPLRRYRLVAWRARCQYCDYKVRQCMNVSPPSGTDSIILANSGSQLLMKALLCAASRFRIVFPANVCCAVEVAGVAPFSKHWNRVHSGHRTRHVNDSRARSSDSGDWVV